jgi:ABC-2 type transport system permease protein
MRVIDLAWKDLRQLARDWKAAVFLVAFPVIFTLMFGLAFGGFGGGEEDPRLPVGFLDQDDGGVLASRLLELLDASDVVRPVVLAVTEPEVETAVREQELAAAVIVPPGYGERTLAGDVIRMAVIADEHSAAGSTARSEIRTAAYRLAASAQIARLSVEVYEAQAGFADGAARQGFVHQALQRALAAWKAPALAVSVTHSGATAEGEPSEMESNFSHLSPAMMVQFAMAGLMGAGEIVVLERKSRALRRLLTTAISRVQIILGHFLAMFVMIFLQFVVLVGFGQAVLRVGYLREPLAVLLMMVTTALWTASLGLLIGVLAKTEEQVILFSLIPMFVLAGMGGAWVPLESTGSTFQAIGHLLPTAWALDGFENIVIRGLGLDSVFVPAGIVLAYAVLQFGLAAWRFRFE